MRAAVPPMIALLLSGCAFDPSGVAIDTDGGQVAWDTSIYDVTAYVDHVPNLDVGMDSSSDAPPPQDLQAGDTRSDISGTTDLPTPADASDDTGTPDLVVVPDSPVDMPLTDTLAPDLVGPVCSWSHRRKLTFKNSQQTQDLKSFPVLVVFQQGSSIDYTKTQNAGQDLRFTDQDGTTVIPHEIERWDEQGKSYVWVRVPQIDGSSATDQIWVYYGHPTAPDGQNPAKVWDTGYVGVWHLNEIPDGTAGDIRDSSPASSHGTSMGGMSAADQVNGQIGWCLDFDGSNDYIDMGDRPQFDVQTYSWSLWLNANGAPTVGVGNEQPLWNADTNFNFGWSHWGAAFKQAAAHRDSADWRAAQIPGTLSASTWYYIAGTYDGSTLTVYLNGSPADTQSAGAPVASSGPLTIGAPISGGIPFPGKVEEVRVSNVARSADWIKAQFLSMTDAFVTYGAEQTAAPGCPK